MRTSEVHKLAIKLDKLYEKEVNKAVRKAGGAGKAKAVSHDDRDRFCKALFQLKAAEVGRVVEMLDELCPVALDKSAKDEVDLNVDAISNDTYRKVEAYVRDCLTRGEARGDGGGSKRKKARSAEGGGGGGAADAATEADGAADAQEGGGGGQPAQ